MIRIRGSHKKTHNTPEVPCPCCKTRVVQRPAWSKQLHALNGLSIVHRGGHTPTTQLVIVYTRSAYWKRRSQTKAMPTLLRSRQLKPTATVKATSTAAVPKMWQNAMKNLGATAPVERCWRQIRRPPKGLNGVWDKTILSKSITSFLLSITLAHEQSSSWKARGGAVKCLLQNQNLWFLRN